jgi:pimeloyl-ACP methyl ester carboxylesterase
MPLYVDETGSQDAPSIVFLHGIGASGWMWWRQTAALGDFHCLNVDLPGHGKSSQVTWISLADTTQQVADLIRSRANNGQAHVVGLSLGGHIALELLERHAELITRAVISGVTAAPMPNRYLLNPQIWFMSLIMKRRWYADLQAKALHLPPDEQAAFTENLLKMSMKTYRRIAEEVVVYQVPSVFQQVNVPTLITAGGRESQIILQAVDVISNLMPNAQGCIAPGLSHGWNVEAPDLFNAMIRAWITEAPLPTGLKVLH